MYVLGGGGREMAVLCSVQIVTDHVEILLCEQPVNCEEVSHGSNDFYKRLLHSLVLSITVMNSLHNRFLSYLLVCF